MQFEYVLGEAASWKAAAYLIPGVILSRKRIQVFILEVSASDVEMLGQDGRLNTVFK